MVYPQRCVGVSALGRVDTQGKQGLPQLSGQEQGAWEETLSQ